MATNTQLHLPIRAVPMPVFPTLNTLQEVIELAESRLPITTKNDLQGLLFTYHNTLLKVAAAKPTFQD